MNNEDTAERLVPSKEVEKAYLEGWNDSYASEDSRFNAYYKASRARRVAEGEEV